MIVLPCLFFLLIFGSKDRQGAGKAITRWGWSRPCFLLSKFADLTFVRHSFGLPALPYKASGAVCPIQKDVSTHCTCDRCPLNAAGVLRPGQMTFFFMFLHTSCQVQSAHPE